MNLEVQQKLESSVMSDIHKLLETTDAIDTFPKKHWLKLITLFGGLLVIIILLMIVIAGMTLTQRSQIAAVVAPGVTLRATVSGTYNGADFEAGSQLEPNQLLGWIVSPDVVVRTAALAATLDAAKLEVNHQVQRLAELKDATTVFKSLAQKRLQALQVRISNLHDQVTLSHDLIRKRDSLTQKGYYSSNLVEQQRETEMLKEAELRNAEAEALLAEIQYEISQYGMTALSDTGTFESERSLLIKVSQVEATSNNTAEQLRNIDNSVKVKSPCKCQVVNVMIRPGETISIGGKLFTFRDSEKIDLIEAMLPIDKIDGLAAGAKATVVLGTGTVAYGVLEKLSFDADPHLIGLPDDAITANRSYNTIALIRLNAPEDIPIGTPADVFIHSHPLTNLLARLRVL